MSRTRRAGISAAFGYLQFALAFLSGIVMVPFILRGVGSEAYGLWLGFGELLAYGAMVDLGVLNVLPWLVAESDGRGDRDGLRSLVSGGVVLGAIAALAFAVLALALLALAPWLTGVTAAQRATVAGPIFFLLGGMALAYPVRAFYSVLIGLQDVTFAGIMSLAQVALNVALLAGLLLGGYGLYALAAASTLPMLAAGLVSMLRLRKIAPDLLRCRRPPLELLKRITVQGFGSWTASLGWRMVAASNSLVVLSVAGPEAAVVYAMTAKLGDVAMQMSWQLPDAGLVGLAQLKGEGRPERVREVVVSLLRLVLLGSGGVACAVLAFNPSFVRLWVGPERFGGLGLNALLAGAVLAHSVVHGLFTSSATLGTRVQAGWAALAQGAAHLALAVGLGRAFGLAGVAAAGVLGALFIAYPAGVWMLRRVTGMHHGELWRSALGPWSARGAFLLLLGAGVGALAGRVSVWLPLALAPALAVLYVWTMRPLYAGLPLPARVRPLLVRLRLVPG